MGDSVTDISGSLLADWLQTITYCYDSVHFIYCNSSSVTESSCEKEVNEENNLPVENSDSAKFPLHLVRKQLEVTPSMKAENSGYERKQLDSENVESHSSGDDITEKEYESKVPCRDKVENWDTFGSKVVSINKKASTATTSARFATHNVVKESGLDGDQKDLRMKNNDEISRSRGKETE